MRQHIDHIYTLFDGSVRGVPVLSIVGLLNDNYKGGEFVFFDDYEVKLKIGDIMIFPSNFMFKHEVKEILEGDRFSFVSWAF
jgi:predicted 2-oxoglutarate/Fe(II)-dependent dioxygenase YbiX